MRIVYKSETPDELVFDSLKDCLLHEKSYYIAQIYKCYCRYDDYKKTTRRKKFNDYLFSNTKKRKYYWQERLSCKAALKEAEDKLLALKKEWHGYIKLEKKTRLQLANISRGQKLTLEEIKQAAEREYGAVPYPITDKELFIQGSIFGVKLAMSNGWNDRHKIPIAAEPQPQCSNPLVLEKPRDATSWLNRGI